MTPETIQHELEAFRLEYGEYLNSITLPETQTQDAVSSELRFTTAEGLEYRCILSDAGWELVHPFAIPSQPSTTDQVLVGAHHDAPSHTRDLAQSDASLPLTHSIDSKFFATSQAMVSAISPAFRSKWGTKLLDELNVYARRQSLKGDETPVPAAMGEFA